MSKDDRNTKPTKHTWLDAVMGKNGPPNFTRRAVLLAFARWVSRDGDVGTVSASMLAEQLHSHPRTIQKHLQIALREGWLERLGIDGRFMTRRYRLAVPQVCMEAAPTYESRRGYEPEPEGAAYEDRRGYEPEPYNTVGHGTDTTNTEERETSLSLPRACDDEIDWKEGIDREAADYLEGLSLRQGDRELNSDELASVERFYREHKDEAIREFAEELLSDHAEALAINKEREEA